MDDLNYILSVPMAIMACGIVGHVLRGIWRPFAPRKNPDADFTFWAQWKARTLKDYVTRDAFYLSDYLLRIDLTDDGFYELMSLRNAWISTFHAALSFAAIFLVLEDSWQIYIKLVDQFMLWRFG